MLIAGIILGVCIILAGIRQVTYSQRAATESAAASAAVETMTEETEAQETTNE